MSLWTHDSAAGSQPFSSYLGEAAGVHGAGRARLPQGGTALRNALAQLRAVFAFGARCLQQTQVRRNTARRLQVTETVSLGEKRLLSIVQVDDTQFLIGSSATSVQLLAQLEAKPAGAAPVVETRRKSA